MNPIIKASTTIESGHWLIFTRNGKGMLEDTSVEFVQVKQVRHVTTSEVGLSLTIGENIIVAGNGKVLEATGLVSHINAYHMVGRYREIPLEALKNLESRNGNRPVDLSFDTPYDMRVNLEDIVFSKGYFYVPKDSICGCVVQANGMVREVTTVPSLVKIRVGTY